MQRERAAQRRLRDQELGLTHCVDDHPVAHAALAGAVKFQFFSGLQDSPVPPYGIHVLTWADATGAVTATLRKAA